MTAGTPPDDGDHRGLTLDQYVRRRQLALADTLSGRKAVYLDTKYWLILRDVVLGRRTDDDSSMLLELLRQGVAAGRLFCPFSDAHFVEVMRQTDITTLTATARLIDELSQGVALVALQRRGATELAHFIYRSRGRQDLYPLSSLVWTKTTYVLGENHPSGLPFGRKETLTLQKAFVDHVWNLRLEQMIASLAGQSTAEDTQVYVRLADEINADIERFRANVTSFQRVRDEEFEGMGLALAEQAADIVLDVSRDTVERRKTEEWSAASLEWRDRIGTILKNPDGPRDLPTAFVQASLHAAVRWSKNRKFKPNDFPDFQHASAALPYCDAFLTEGSLSHLIQEKHLGLCDHYPCRSAANESDALDLVWSLLEEKDGDILSDEERRQCIADIKASIEFLGGGNKWGREKMTVEQFLQSLGISYDNDELKEAGEPTDVAFRGAKFQVKELMDAGRRRSKEYQDAIKKLLVAKTRSELLEHYSPISVTFSDVVAQCYARAEALLKSQKYGRAETASIDLIVYFNREDYEIAPAVDVERPPLAFRSLTVVGGIFAAVVYAKDDAPDWIREAAGRLLPST